MERDKEEDGFVRLGLEEIKERDTVGGARLTIETGSDFPIGITGSGHARFFPAARWSRASFPVIER